MKGQLKENLPNNLRYIELKNVKIAVQHQLNIMIFIYLCNVLSKLHLSAVTSLSISHILLFVTGSKQNIMRVKLIDCQNGKDESNVKTFN